MLPFIFYFNLLNHINGYYHLGVTFFHKQNIQYVEHYLVLNESLTVLAKMGPKPLLTMFKSMNFHHI